VTHLLEPRPASLVPEPAPLAPLAPKLPGEMIFSSPFSTRLGSVWAGSLLAQCWYPPAEEARGGREEAARLLTPQPLLVEKVKARSI
jgi:hypothetical protein